jgi:threonine-phosphate decarboxylase
LETIRHIHGGNIREAAEKYGLAEHQIIDFSANINPLGPSQKAIDAIIGSISVIVHYPDPEATILRNTVSDWLDLPVNMIVAGNGAVEIIYLLMKLLKPRKVLIPVPTFNEYEIAVRIAGGQVKDLLLSEEKGFVIDKEDIFAQWEDSDIVFVCNPNNPTGCLTLREDLVDIICRAEKAGKTVVVDEAFMDFVPEREKYSVTDLVKKHDNLFVLYSLTKFFAIPGLRLGIGLGSLQVIEKLNQIRDPWNVNCFAQIAGTVSLNDRQYIDATIENISVEKDYLFHQINTINGFKPSYPSVNYIFINLEGTGCLAPDICRMLGEQGILVRDCSSYKNLRPVYIRVAVRQRKENDKLIQMLQQLGRKD